MKTTEPKSKAQAKKAKTVIESPIAEKTEKLDQKKAPPKKSSTTKKQAQSKPGPTNQDMPGATSTTTSPIDPGRAEFDHFVTWLHDQKLKSILKPESLSAFYRHFLTPEFMAANYRQNYYDLFDQEYARLKKEGRKIRDYLSALDMKRIEDFLAEPTLIKKRWIEEFLKQRVFEEAISNTIYAALKEFSEKVNPFFDASNPVVGKLMKLFDPLGINRSILKKLKEAFEGELEEKIRLFLKSFSKNALQNIADFTTSRTNETLLVMARQNIFRNLINQDVKVLLHEIEVSAINHIKEISFSSAEFFLRQESTLSFIDRTVDRFFEKYGEQSLREIMRASHGDEARWEADIIGLLWPVFQNYTLHGKK